MAERRLTDAEILQQIPQARAAERVARKRGHRARAVHYDRATGRIVVELSSGVLFAFPVTSVPALRRVSPMALAQVALNPAGSVVSWEALDVDVSVAGLLLAAVDPAERVRHLATLAGRTTSPAKAAAARENGAKGGRPRKVVTRAQSKPRHKKIAV